MCGIRDFSDTIKLIILNGVIILAYPGESQGKSQEGDSEVRVSSTRYEVGSSNQRKEDATLSGFKDGDEREGWGNMNQGI